MLPWSAAEDLQPRFYFSQTVGFFSSPIQLMKWELNSSKAFLHKVWHGYDTAQSLFICRMRDKLDKDSSSGSFSTLSWRNCLKQEQNKLRAWFWTMKMSLIYFNIVSIDCFFWSATERPPTTVLFLSNSAIFLINPSDGVGAELPVFSKR